MIRTTTAILALLVLGACSHDIGAYGDASDVFGNAVRQNIAAQTVNPQGSSADVTASAARVAKANKAYAADQVEKPAPVGTSAQSASAADAK
jgi:hypothetical protein